MLLPGCQDLSQKELPPALDNWGIHQTLWGRKGARTLRLFLLFHSLWIVMTSNHTWTHFQPCLTHLRIENLILWGFQELDLFDQGIHQSHHLQIASRDYCEDPVLHWGCNFLVCQRLNEKSLGWKPELSRGVHLPFKIWDKGNSYVHPFVSPIKKAAAPNDTKGKVSSWKHWELQPVRTESMPPDKQTIWPGIRQILNELRT